MLFHLLLLVALDDGVSFGKHALVQDARNQNPSGFLAVKHDMPAALHSAQTGANIITASTKGRILGQHPATLFKIVDVIGGLVLAPRAESIGADAE